MLTPISFTDYYLFMKMSTVREKHIPYAATASKVAIEERLLQMQRAEDSRTELVKTVSSTTTVVKYTNSHSRTANKLMTETVLNDTLSLKTKDYLENVSFSTVWDATSGLAFLFGNALRNFLSQHFSNTSSQPDITLQGLLNRLVCKLAKSWLRSADFQQRLPSMIGDVLQSETRISNMVRVVVDSQNFIGSMT